jgi:hypothetical protein
MQLQKVTEPAAEVDVKALEQELLEKDRQLKITRLQLDKLRTTIAKAMRDDGDAEAAAKKAAAPKRNRRRQKP